MTTEATTRTYRGSGGSKPAPRDPNSKPSKFRGPAYILSEKVGDNEKKVTPFMVRVGTKSTPVVTLDHGEFDFAVLLHARFKANGSWSNYVVCTKKSDPKGCPVCSVFTEKPSQWFLCGTLVDRSVWVIPDGKNKGKEISNQRRLLLVTASQVDQMELIGGKIGGWRGAVFDVGRSTDQKSPRIGSNWFYSAKMTEEDMLELFEPAAAGYGLPVDQYIEPFNYEEILKPKSFEEMTKIAAAIKAEGAQELAPASSVSNEADVPF